MCIRDRLRDQGTETTYVLGGLLGSLLDPQKPASFGESRPLVGDELIRVTDSEATRAARDRLTESLGPDIHAGERETSLIMRFFADTLDREVDFRRLEPAPERPELFGKAALSGGWRRVSPLGYIGDPAKATSENGELYELEAADVSAAIAEFLRAKL
jgi:creatinine amidohydrolase/Fe(II)-dependent formamide hydrolase-like protein